MARLRSDIWVAAYLRTCEIAGGSVVLRRRGAAEAGAIYIKIDLLQGDCRLLGPAPPGLDDADVGRRRFASVRNVETMPVADAEERIRRELNFDSDLWLIEVEDREGRDFLDRMEG